MAAHNFKLLHNSKPALVDGGNAIDLDRDIAAACRFDSGSGGALLVK
jgi:hypothetical protein